MRKFWFALLAACAIAAPASAQFVAPGNMPSGSVLGYCFLSQTGVAVLATACTIPFGTKWAWVESENAAIRERADGTAPTASVGFAMPGGSASSPAYIALSASLTAVQLIPQTGTMTLNIEFRN